MKEFLQQILIGPGDFEPHYVHFTETPELMWLNIMWNALIALAYFTIPIALWHFARRRKDLEFKGMFRAFALFITSCGVTHVLHIVIYWYPVYWLEMAITGVTAFASLAVAVALWYFMPIALKIPTPSELAAAELEIKRKEEELAMQRELELRRSEFISAASHELKTPLTSQRILVETVHKSLEERGIVDYSKHLTRILGQTRRLSQLVENLLDVARIEGGKIIFAEDEFDLDECAQEVVDDLQAVTPTHHMRIEGSIGRPVRGDRERISQVIVNLLTNAVKYSPGAKDVIVRLSNDGNSALVCIEDFGIGIGSEHHVRLFERFYRVEGASESTYPGLGIGLFISAEIVRSHRGSIWVESERGKGSRFWFSLPLAPAFAEAEGAPHADMV